MSRPDPYCPDPYCPYCPVEIELYEGGKFTAYAESPPKTITVNGALLESGKISYQGAKLVLDLDDFRGEKVRLGLAW